MSDRLLEWLSYRRSGRADALPSELTGSNPHRSLASLSLLGHIELEDSSTWRVAPPTLAALPKESNNQAAAVLCGARTAGVVRRLTDACETTGAAFSELQQSDSPSIIQVSAECGDILIRTAQLAEINFQYDAGYSLLACVPAIRNWPRQPCQMTGGRVGTVRRFSGSQARWVVSSLSEAQSAPKGFFKIKRDWDWVSILKLSRDDCSYIDDRAGRMLSAAKLRHAGWDTSNMIFTLPALLFPPSLIARALVLCTGLLPEFDRGTSRIVFRGVNAEMLRLVLSITGLRLA